VNLKLPAQVSPSSPSSPQASILTNFLTNLTVVLMNFLVVGALVQAQTDDPGELDDRAGRLRSKSFRGWLKQFRRDETAIGDLARDVARDRCWPRSIAEDRLERYEDHLTDVHHAETAAIETLRLAWDAYGRGAA